MLMLMLQEGLHVALDLPKARTHLRPRTWRGRGVACQKCPVAVPSVCKRLVVGRTDTEIAGCLRLDSYWQGLSRGVTSSREYV